MNTRVDSLIEQVSTLQADVFSLQVEYHKALTFILQNESVLSVPEWMFQRHHQLGNELNIAILSESLKGNKNE